MSNASREGSAGSVGGPGSAAGGIGGLSGGSGGGFQSGPNGGSAGPRALLTRRNLLIGAAGVAGVAGVAGIAKGVNYVSEKMHADEEIPVLNIPANNVIGVDTFTEVDASEGVGLRSSIELPYGSLVWSCCSDVAVALVPTNSSSPLTYVSLLSLGSGTDVDAIEKPVGLSQGYEIYDVRANDQSIIWLESNVLQGVWRVYSAEVSSLVVGEPALMQEGVCSEWETPTLAVAGPYVYWQVLPNVDGEFARDQSTLKKAKAGGSTYYTVLASTGRMATAPYSLNDRIVVTPRAEAEGVVYQPTLLDAETDEVLDTVQMPQNMKPFEVGYGKNGFFIAMDAIYNYGDGLSNLGSYTPVSKVATAAEYSDAEWFTYTRQPSAAPCWSGSWFIVKSTQAVCGFNPEKKQNFVLSVQGGSEYWGDYLATTGICDTFVTFAHVDYSPMNAGVVNEDGELLGELETAMNCTLVRSWMA